MTLFQIVRLEATYWLSPGTGKKSDMEMYVFSDMDKSPKSSLGESGRNRKYTPFYFLKINMKN